MDPVSIDNNNKSTLNNWLSRSSSAANNNTTSNNNNTTSSKRYSLNLGNLRRSSSSTKVPISTSAITIDTSTATKNLQPINTNELFNGGNFYSLRKRNSYSLSTNLKESLEQSSQKFVIRDLKVTVPTLVHKCCQFILENELLEGLFRINSSLKKIKYLESKIHESLNDNHDFEFMELLDNTKKNDPNTMDELNSYDVSMVLKRYLNNLDHYLINKELYGKLVKNHNGGNTAIESPDSLQSFGSCLTSATAVETYSPFSSRTSLVSDDSTNTSCSVGNVVKTETQLSKDVTITSMLSADAKLLVSSLPLESLNLLIYLLDHLSSLINLKDFTEITKMSSITLSKIFQISIFEYSNEINDSADNLLNFYKKNEEILRNWIENFDIFFNELVKFMNLQKEGQLSAPVSASLSPTTTSISPEDQDMPHPTIPLNSFENPPDFNASYMDANTSADNLKKSRRKSLFGFSYRSFSSPSTNTIHSGFTNTKESLTLTSNQQNCDDQKAEDSTNVSVSTIIPEQEDTFDGSDQAKAKRFPVEGNKKSEGGLVKASSVLAHSISQINVPKTRKLVSSRSVSQINSDGKKNMNTPPHSKLPSSTSNKTTDINAVSSGWTDNKAVKAKRRISSYIFSTGGGGDIAGKDRDRSQPRSFSETLWKDPTTGLAKEPLVSNSISRASHHELIRRKTFNVDTKFSKKKESLKETFLAADDSIKRNRRLSLRLFG